MFRPVAWQQGRRGALGAVRRVDESTVRAAVLFAIFRQVRRAVEVKSRMSGRVGGLAGSAAQRSRIRKDRRGRRSVLVEVEEPWEVGLSERPSVASNQPYLTLGGADEPGAAWAPGKVWIGPAGLGMCCEVRQ